MMTFAFLLYAIIVVFLSICFLFLRCVACIKSSLLLVELLSRVSDTFIGHNSRLVHPTHRREGLQVLFSEVHSANKLRVVNFFFLRPKLQVSFDSLLRRASLASDYLVPDALL